MEAKEGVAFKKVAKYGLANGEVLDNEGETYFETVARKGNTKSRKKKHKYATLVNYCEAPGRLRQPN